MNQAQLSALIDEVEKLLFVSRFPNDSARKDAVKAAVSACPDDNIRHLLGLASGYAARHPAWSRSEISKARGYVASFNQSLKGSAK
jgi:hypothetical protein